MLSPDEDDAVGEPLDGAAFTDWECNGVCITVDGFTIGCPFSATANSDCAVVMGTEGLGVVMVTEDTKKQCIYEAEDCHYESK